LDKNQKMKNSILIIFLILFQFYYTSNAQQMNTETSEDRIEKITISKKSINEYRQNDSFDYTVEVRDKNIIDRFFSWLKRNLIYYGQKMFDWIFGQEKGGKYLMYFLKSLPYIAILIFLYFIFRYLLGIDLIRLKRRKNIKFPMVDMTDEERIMQEEDLKKLIADAEANKDYRLAVRYHYLSLLKKLVDKGLIDWRPEKTNRDYVYELQNSSFSSDFIKLTFVYDYVWYGNFMPDHNAFEEINTNFLKFKVD